MMDMKRRDFLIAVSMAAVFLPTLAMTAVPIPAGRRVHFRLEKLGTPEYTEGHVSYGMFIKMIQVHPGFSLVRAEWI